MQPTYLPWAGYFEMISNVDLFIILDNVQFEKKSWQHRNRIRTSSGELLLTVPVNTASKFSQLITEVQISRDTNFVRKHLTSIRNSYSKTKYFDQLFPELEQILNSNQNLLLDLNESLIRTLCKHLEISTKIIRASELKAEGKGSELTVAQCIEVGGSYFYAAKGSMPYVSQQLAFAATGIEVGYQSYDHPIYPQVHGNFISSLSVIDLIFNCGLDSKYHFS